MVTTTYQGHVELHEQQLGATLLLKPDGVTLEVACPAEASRTPERLNLVRFTSNKGYFTIINLFRRSHNSLVGVAGLSTYTDGLALENVHFHSLDEIKSRIWRMNVADSAKILHVNGVDQSLEMLATGAFVLSYTISSPLPVILNCANANISVELGQNIQTSGDRFNGPTITLSYPVTIVFAEEVGIDVALRTMYRVRGLFSILMGRVLPVTSTSLATKINSEEHEFKIHGLISTEAAAKPSEPLLQPISAPLLTSLLDQWLSRYDDLEDAIQLHMTGLEQRKLPTELRFQIFIQSLEALHRRTSEPAGAAIDTAPILETLRDHNISSDVIDRVAGVLAHAHEPGLRKRLRHYWDTFATEFGTLRPNEDRKRFIDRVAKTRNYYAHRTDRDEDVLEGPDLWDATEAIKAMSHMALLREIGADTGGIGAMMLQQSFVQFVIRD